MKLKKSAYTSEVVKALRIRRKHKAYKKRRAYAKKKALRKQAERIQKINRRKGIHS